MPFLEVIEIFLQWLELRIREYHTLLTRNMIFISRTAGLGILSPEMAVSYGCTGPVLRGSGVDFDLRRDGEAIYTRMYKGYDFDVPVAPFKEAPREVIVGDNWCRFYVRMMEVVQAIRLVRQSIPKYKAASGSYREPFKMNAKLPKDEVYLETEAPRGQMGFYLVGNGEGNPLRLRAKSSCFCNVSVTDQICQGVPLADIPAIVGSLDIVMGEIDR
jgi:NADH-quinone oxidoreductase subunit D